MLYIFVSVNYINNCLFLGNNLCCLGCDKLFSVYVNLVKVIFKGGNNIELGKLGFEIIIIMGSDLCKFVFFYNLLF